MTDILSIILLAHYFPMRKTIFILVCFITTFAISAEYTVQSIPNPITPNAHAYVSNPDGILCGETVQEMNVLIDSLKLQTGAEVAVVAVNSIGSADINNFATELFSTWKIGKAKQDNGLLILFVMDQRKVKFETGYGLEGVLPDAICKRIQMRAMIPAFKKGNYDAGMFAGLQLAALAILKEPVAEVKAKPIAWSEILPYAIGLYILLILITCIWMANSIAEIIKNSKLNSNLARYKAIKSERSGMISLVGVMLPIVAAVVILFFSNPIFLLLVLPIPFTTIPANLYGRLLMLKVRREPIACNVCDGKMHILSEKKEDKYLKLAQQFEEKLHAVDYDVFVCDKCANEAIFSLDKPSAYSDCPKCGTKAFIQIEKRTLIAPTYVSPGTQRTTCRCKFCGYEENHKNNIPRLNRSEGALLGGAVVGGLFSGGGGFGGGESSSGGSFGGGMSGGGGSSSDW